MDHACADAVDNPDSGISMRRLNNGHVILVFNNQDNARTPLHIVRSTDEARTWEKPLILETNPGEYSYPSVLQTQGWKDSHHLYVPPLFDQARGDE